MKRNKKPSPGTHVLRYASGCYFAGPIGYDRYTFNRAEALRLCRQQAAYYADAAREAGSVCFAVPVDDSRDSARVDKLIGAAEAARLKYSRHDSAPMYSGGFPTRYGRIVRHIAKRILTIS